MHAWRNDALTIYIQGIVGLIVSGVWNNYDYRWMVMLDFICMGSTELSEQAGIEKFKMKIYVSSGIPLTPRHDKWNRASDHSVTLVRYQVGY